MYHIRNEQAFREALLHQNLQHISGRINFSDGTAIALDDSNILGCPQIDTRIITDSETFNIAELYIGTLELELLSSGLTEHQLIGAEISLQVSIDLDSGDRSDPIPMGVWDIVSAPVQAGDTRKITAYDHIARLAAPLGDTESSGIIWFSQVIARIKAAAKVNFTQTFDDLNDLDPNIQVSEIYPASTHYAATCWQEVQYIAQYLGCYVIATRDGRIEFRKYTLDAPVRTITADERFSSQVNGDAFFVRGFGYTDKYGRTVESLAPAMNDNEAKIYIPQENVFAVDVVGPQYEDIYLTLLRPLKDEFAMLGWYTGTVDYYGDPTLDVGDTVYLTGGTMGQGLRRFLICQNTWKFRGAQSLVSGGAPRLGNTVTASGSGSSSSSGGSIVYNTKDIIIDPFKSYQGELFDIARTAAKCRFSVSELTAVFVSFTLTVSGSAAVEVLFDDTAIYPLFTASGTISVTLPVSAGSGTHTSDILISGTDELTTIKADVWGQELTALAPLYDETYWEYETDDSSATITGYTGEEEMIEVPDTLGAKSVTTIADGALSGNTDIEAVYIPEGIITIE